MGLGRKASDPLLAILGGLGFSHLNHDPSSLLTLQLTWNFEKYLVDKSGTQVSHPSRHELPTGDVIEAKVQVKLVENERMRDAKLERKSRPWVFHLR